MRQSSSGVRYDSATKQAARNLAQRGYRPAQIKSELRIDASLSTIMRWLDPEKAKAEHEKRREAHKAYMRKYNQRNRKRLLPKRKRRQKQAFAALHRQEEARRVAKAGGSVATAYGLVRKAAQELDRALLEVGSPVRPSVRAALAALHEAEDAVVRASRIPDNQQRQAA